MWAAFAIADLPSAWSQQLVERGSSSVTSASWSWLCGHPRTGLLKVSVSVLLRALCYYGVLPCAARLQLLNLAVEEQQAGSWQGTFCSFLVYLPIPNDQVLGNNWHLPDLAVFRYPLTNKVSSNGSEFAWSSDSTPVCLELLGAFVQAVSLFNLCTKTLSKQPSYCPHQRKNLSKLPYQCGLFLPKLEVKQASRNPSGTRSCCLSKRQTAVSHSGSHMRGHAVQLLLCPELSRGQRMLQCLSGGCSSQVQHWPAL